MAGRKHVKIQFDGLVNADVGGCGKVKIWFIGIKQLRQRRAIMLELT